MKIRDRNLPEGWYPSSEAEIHSLLDSWSPENSSGNAVAGLVPHAGWAFCGPMISEVLSSFSRKIDGVVVLGGHNPPGADLISYHEDVWDFPSGRLSRDNELVAALSGEMKQTYKLVHEGSPDNTVEVVMAMVASVIPDIPWAAWRIPADSRALDLGRWLAAYSRESGRHIAVIGSTDLTHYGPNYGFEPAESLDDPVSWTRDRDTRFLQALVTYQGERALELAGSERSACSAGAAVSVMAFAEAMGCGEGKLLSYRTSRDVYASSSFVGYGSILWDAD